MEEPSPRSSRLALAGAVLAIVVVGSGGFLLGRMTTQREPAAVVPPVAAPVAKAAPEPVSSGVLGRVDLVALASAAADAAAAGGDPGPDIAQAGGRRFELRLPFGCEGPAADDSAAAMRWRYDATAGALRISVAPVAWAAQDWWPSEAPKGVEAVEGFWIARPWTSSDACPPAGGRPAAGGEPVTLPEQTLALGQIFFAEGGRGGRREDKPYEAVVRLAEADLQAAEGFRVRISGRIARTGDIGPVHCRRAGGPDQRPVCLVNVVMDEVAVEYPATGKTLATWRLAGPGVPES